MSQIAAMGSIIGSRRYARDKIAHGSNVRTCIWWDIPDPNDGREERERSQQAHAQSDAEEQRRSFVYGNCNLANPNVTRAMVDEVAERERAIPAPQFSRGD